MSSIVSPENTTLLQETMNPDGGLDVVGQKNEVNLIKITGDAPVGIVGGNLMDTITTGAGDAVVFGKGGDDIIKAGNGNDILRGGVGDDVIHGGLGADFLSGGAGNDTLRGGFPAVDEEGNPSPVFDDDGNPVLDKDGNQLLGDTLNGGMGNDVFEFSVSEFDPTVVDKIEDFRANDDDDKIRIFDKSDEIKGFVYDDVSGIFSITDSENTVIGKIDIGEGLVIGNNDFKENIDTGTWELF